MLNFIVSVLAFVAAPFLAIWWIVRGFPIKELEKYGFDLRVVCPRTGNPHEFEEWEPFGAVSMRRKCSRCGKGELFINGRHVNA